MFVKMLTHLHMVVYTWWCWHIYKGGGAFEKIKRTFSIAPVGKLEKLTLVLAAPDAGPERPVWCLWRRCAPDAPE